MLGAISLILVGLAVLVAGAELLTRGGSAIAVRFGVPPIVIGLTIVAVGTSAPELGVGIDAALQGNGALAVGNIAGTNVVNMLLILGSSALIRPLAIRMDTLRLDLPAMLVASIAMLVLSIDGDLSRLDGALLVGMGVIYTWLVVRAAQRERRAIRREYGEEYKAPPPETSRSHVIRNLVLLIGGIAVIVVGSDWFVEGAVALARLWGVTDAFIGLTVVAIGTSSPEFVTTLIGTIRNHRDIAIGNLLGSSVYNIVFILGVTCLMPTGGLPVTANLIAIDIPILVAVAFLCVPVFITGRQVSRIEGGLMVAAYIGYLAYLIVLRA